jgi:hypothetical protein
VANVNGCSGEMCRLFRVPGLSNSVSRVLALHVGLTTVDLLIDTVTHVLIFLRLFGSDRFVVF